MSKRSRIAAFGCAGLLVVAGAVVTAVVGGGTGPVVGMVLIGVGLVGAVSLLFLEVGLSEDAERTRSSARPGGRRPARPDLRTRRPRLERSRGQRRRLRNDDR